PLRSAGTHPVAKRSLVGCDLEQDMLRGTWKPRERVVARRILEQRGGERPLRRIEDRGQPSAIQPLGRVLRRDARGKQRGRDGRAPHERTYGSPPSATVFRTSAQ